MSRFMIAGAERADGRRGVTWYTILGLLLVPLTVGGLLLWSLHDPTTRMDRVTAAVVNNDRPVTVEGRTVPLGRQLAAGLVGAPGSAGTGDGGAGDGNTAKNFTWVLTDSSDATRGLSGGRYAAVVTIPKGFSAAATSSTHAAHARAATIRVQSAQRGGILDDALTSAVTQTATRLFGHGITTRYLDNVYVGFTTLHDKLGDARAGAVKIADGTQNARHGADKIASGAAGLASGARSLDDGLGRLDTGATRLAGGAATLASGARDLAAGGGTLAASLDKLHDGLAGPRGLKTGVGALASGAGTLADGTAALASGTTRLGDGLARLQAEACAPQAGDQRLCQSVTTLAQQAAGLARGADQTRAGAKQVAAGTQALNTQAGALVDGIGAAASGARSLSSGAAKLSSGAAATTQGASGLASGVKASVRGASGLASGASSLASNIRSFAAGLGTLAEGSTSVADGLGTAASAVPTYSKTERAGLADAVANPVKIAGGGTGLFSAAAVPFLAAIALWVGALALFVVLGARTRDAFTSRASTWRLLARSAWLPSALGIAQGLAVAGIAQLALDMPVGRWAAFAAAAALSGVAFATVIQAVVAWARGTGLFAGALAGALALAAGIVSTAPGALRSVAAALPTEAARHALLGAVTGQAEGAALAGLAAWALAGLAVTGLAVVRARSVDSRTLARAGLAGAR